MDKPRFAYKSVLAKTNHTDGGDLSTRPAIAPAENGGLDEIKSAVLAKLALDLGKDASLATDRDWFVAAALTIRDRIVHRWLAVDRATHAQGRKRVYYLSLEFLIGRLFADVLCNLGCTEIFRAALGDLGVDLNRLRAVEPDACSDRSGYRLWTDSGPRLTGPRILRAGLRMSRARRCSRRHQRSEGRRFCRQPPRPAGRALRRSH
jgi:hypothetical protein